MDLPGSSQAATTAGSWTVLPAGRVVGNLRKSLAWAWLDTRSQYRRSRIGPLWETINVIVMLGGLTLVSSAVFGSSIGDIIGYIGLGIIIWSAVSALFAEGSATFVRNSSYITSSTISIDIYVGRSLFKILINFAHHLVLYFIGVALALVPIGWTSLLAIPGIVLLFINGFWIVTALGLICARFRDVEPIVRNLLQLAFFVTPVFWNYQNIASNRRFLVEYNILFYLIEVIRSPLLGQVPPLGHYLAILVLTVIGYALAYLVYRRMRPELAFCV